MLSFKTLNVKIAVTYECGRAVPSRKPVYFDINKLL